MSISSELYLIMDSPGTIYIVLFAFFVTIYLVYVRYRNELRDIPGPFLASILPLDRILSTAKGHQFATHIGYHQKHGPLVRIGPNHVSFSDAEAIPLVYSISTKFFKSNFYRLFDAKSPKGDLPTVFSIRDEAAHRALKRPVANAYSMSTMVELEPLTDTCISIFSKKISAMSDRNIDLGEWLHWFSFDVITSITFSNRLGFMEREEDVSGIIDALEGRQFYNSIVGQAPWLHSFLLGNPIIAALANQIPSLARFNSARFIVQFAAKQLQRYQSKDKAIPEYRDMLARFRRYSNGEEVMSEGDLLSHSASNIFAGADTTAISLRSMFYYLCKNPRCYVRVVAEIDAMDDDGGLSAFVTFAESNQLKYLQACMKEAMRLHPAVGMLLERIVPEGGVTIAGKYIPQGTIIGANPWVLARDRTVYGDDADAYRPERWLEADEKALKLMERNFLAFGTGSRTCLGKNISLLEMSKLVPQILRQFTVELVDPKAEWHLADYWFVKQTGVICRVRARSR